jgi:phosphoribosylformylglycinamidine (FGAM) synthase-like enzyme
VDPDETLPIYRALEDATRQGLVRSAATPAMGGLALSLSRCAMAGELGVSLDLSSCSDLCLLPADVALFSESCGRFLVTTSERDALAFAACFRGLACVPIGVVRAEPRIRAKLRGQTILDVDVLALKTSYKETLADA